MDTQRTQRVVIETDRHRITGTLTLPREGYRSRLSDFLNQSEGEFLSLIDTEIAPLDGGSASNLAYLAVSRSHIRMLHPLDDGE